MQPRADTGGPRIKAVIRELVAHIAKDNGWGCSRILSELNRGQRCSAGRTLIQLTFSKCGLNPHLAWLVRDQQRAEAVQNGGANHRSAETVPENRAAAKSVGCSRRQHLHRFAASDPVRSGLLRQR